MGHYYSEEKVVAGGFRKVYPDLDGNQPRTNGRLVGVFNRLTHNVCVDLSKASEWQHFYHEQYMVGLLVSCTLYDVPHNADIEKEIDNGY
jgi:hypothetical protein